LGLTGPVGQFQLTCRSGLNHQINNSLINYSTFTF
jgi:hypothetical protein